MGASKLVFMHGREVAAHSHKVKGADLVACQRCGRGYIPNNFEVCDPCVEELDHNMEVDEEHEQV